MKQGTTPTGEIDKSALYPQLRFTADERLIEEMPKGYFSRAARIRDLHNLIRILQLQVANVETSLDERIDEMECLGEQSAWVARVLERTFPNLSLMREVTKIIIYDTPRYTNFNAANSELYAWLEPLLREEPRFAATVLDLAYQTREKGDDFLVTARTLYEIAREYTKDSATRLGAEIGLIEIRETTKAAGQEQKPEIVANLKTIVTQDPTLTTGTYKREVLRDAIKNSISTAEEDADALLLRASYQLRQNNEVRDEETYFRRVLMLDSTLIDQMISIGSHYTRHLSEKSDAVFKAVVNATKEAKPELSQKVYDAMIATAKELRDEKRYRKCLDLCAAVAKEQPINPHALYFAATSWELRWRAEGHIIDGNGISYLKKALSLYERGKGSSAQQGAARVRALIQNLLK